MWQTKTTETSLNMEQETEQQSEDWVQNCGRQKEKISAAIYQIITDETSDGLHNARQKTAVSTSSSLL